MQAGLFCLSHPRRYPGDVGRRGARARARRGCVVFFCVVIPARYGSTRLPGKPLRLLAGKTMLQHVHERAHESGAAEVVIATDDERIREAAAGFGANVCMPAAAHRSGTDRLAEVAARGAYAPDVIIVNLQGDEPLMPAVLIRQVADDLAAHEAASIATLCERFTAGAELFDPNVVKVVMDRAGYALYFSRAPIPLDRDAFGRDGCGVTEVSGYWRHLGMYAYRAGFLQEYVRWAPAPLERAESLEQLRALWYGHRVHVAEAVVATAAGVDTAEDLARVEALLSRM